MKKSVSVLFSVLTMMTVILGSSVTATPALATTSPHKQGIDYSQEVSWQQEHLWNLGKDLTIGDSYTYRICDPDAILNYSAESYHYFTKNLEHNGSLCYSVQMDFVNLIETDQNDINGLIWVVQAQITDDFTGDVRHSLFHVDSESFEVRSADTIHPDTIRYAKSIQNTLFSLHKYTASESKLLQPGVRWGEVTEYNDRGENPDMKVMDKTTFDVSSYHYEILKQNTITELQELDVFSVGYEVDIVDQLNIIEKKDKEKEENNNVTNSFLVNSHLPFPVSGEYFNPSYVIEPQKEFEFELIKYLETKSNKSPIPIPIPIPDNPDTVPDDLPETITGTIELTFPDDITVDDVVSDDSTPKNNFISDDIVTDDVIHDDIVLDDSITDDVISDDITTLDDPQTTQDDNSTISVIVILVIVLSTVGFVLWKRPSFAWKGKNKSKQNITKTRISFDDKIHLWIQTVSDKDDKNNLLLSKSGG